MSKLGSLVSHISCADATGTGHLAGAETSELNVKTGSTSDNAVSVATDGGRCSLTVPQNYVGLLQTTASVQDALVIVDFVPVSGENSTGIMLRCPQVGQFPCLGLFMYSNESYQCVEAIGGNNNMLAEGSFAGQQFPAPELEISKPNRLVLSVTGNTIAGYINGRQICGGSTKVPVASVPAVVQLAQAGGSVPARVDLLDIYVYAPA